MATNFNEVFNKYLTNKMKANSLIETSLNGNLKSIFQKYSNKNQFNIQQKNQIYDNRTRTYDIERSNPRTKLKTIEGRFTTPRG